MAKGTSSRTRKTAPKADPETLAEPVSDQFPQDPEDVAISAEPVASDEPPAPEPAIEAPVAAQPPEKPKANAVGAAVLGGVVAAAVGFGGGLATGWYGFQSDVSAADVQALNARIDGLDAGAVALDVRVSELSGSKAALEAAINGLGGQISGVEAYSAALETVSGAIEKLDQRLTELENRPPAVIEPDKEAAAAYQREIEALRAEFTATLQKIEAAQVEVAQKQDETAAIGRDAVVRASVARLALAAETGASLNAGLEELRGAGVEIPAVLADHADGVESLQSLKQGFADAARQAIEADIRARADAGEISKLEAFFKIQLGLRSLAPREGSDADAVLARAEGLLTAGDLKGAVDELDAGTLPDAPLLAAWLASARDHLAVVQAIGALAPLGG